MLEAVIIRHLQGGDHGAGVVVLAGGHECRGQIFRIAVDRIAEQHKLHQRHGEHHCEGDPVAPHLDEFLDEQRAEPGKREEAAVAHAILSCALLMNWMKTSSRLVSPRVTVTPGLLAMTARESESNFSSEPTTCNVAPNGATCSTPGRRAISDTMRSSPGPSTTKVTRPASRTTPLTVPVASSLP